MQDQTTEYVPQSPFRILSIDGGGYLGLATAAMIREFEKHFKLSFHERFDMFCGTSTGAILALALAIGKTGEELVELYQRLGKEVFRRPWHSQILGRAGGILRARYGNRALRIALKDTFEEKTFGHLLKVRQKCAMVTAFNITSGSPRVFKTDHSGRLSMDDKTSLVDAALASAAAPTYFPVVAIKRPGTGFTEHFCDGGVVANHPALLGFTEALFEFEKPPSPGEIRVLSLSTPREVLGEGTRLKRDLDRGALMWARKLPQVFIGSSMMISHELLKRLVKSFPEPEPRYIRVDIENPDSLGMDDVNSRSTARLEQLGTKCGVDGTTRDRIAEILL